MPRHDYFNPSCYALKVHRLVGRGAPPVKRFTFAPEVKITPPPIFPICHQIPQTASASSQTQPQAETSADSSPTAQYSTTTKKVNIVRRVLLGLEAVGVERVFFMPDSFSIGPKALDGLQTKLEVSILPMLKTFSQRDSTQAAALMAAEGVGCIVTLGGDGTNRAVAKGCGDIPLMPVSTGTNNVFPTMLEGTIAGMAAGLVTCDLADGAVQRVPRLDIFCKKTDERDQEGDPDNTETPDDIALVDVAVYDERFVASRAIWDASKIRELVLTRVEPGSIGLSSIGAHTPDRIDSPEHGLYLRLGSGGRSILAPIAPGLLNEVSLAESRPLAPGETVTLKHQQPCVLALDGEREIELRQSMTAQLQFNLNGPRVIDARKAIDIAARAGVFIR